MPLHKKKHKSFFYTEEVFYWIFSGADTILGVYNNLFSSTNILI